MIVERVVAAAALAGVFGLVVVGGMVPWWQALPVAAVGVASGFAVGRVRGRRLARERERWGQWRHGA